MKGFLSQLQNFVNRTIISIFILNNNGHFIELFSHFLVTFPQKKIVLGIKIFSGVLSMTQMHILGTQYSYKLFKTNPKIEKYCPITR